MERCENSLLKQVTAVAGQRQLSENTLKAYRPSEVTPVSEAGHVAHGKAIHL